MIPHPYDQTHVVIKPFISNSEHCIQSMHPWDHQRKVTNLMRQTGSCDPLFQKDGAILV